MGCSANYKRKLPLNIHNQFQAHSTEIFELEKKNITVGNHPYRPSFDSLPYPYPVIQLWNFSLK